MMKMLRGSVISPSFFVSRVSRTMKSCFGSMIPLSCSTLYCARIFDSSFYGITSNLARKALVFFRTISRESGSRRKIS